MTYRSSAFTLFFLSFLLACHKPEKNSAQEDLTAHPPTEEVHELPAAEADSSPESEVEKSFASVPDTGFVVMNQYARGFAYDMKYATEDNFLKEKVYTCDYCLLRKEVADALQAANDKLMQRGLRIKFYDCYRPLAIQQQMWKIYPNAKYVANPNTTGSVHNRGGAVDITLVDLEGRELDMGTGFDHFGKEAHHAYTQLPDTVLANRRLLKETMQAQGFNAITSEWWHYSFKAAGKYAVSNFSVACE